jgi:hypothetical protein
MSAPDQKRTSDSASENIRFTPEGGNARVGPTKVREPLKIPFAAQGHIYFTPLRQSLF